MITEKIKNIRWLVLMLQGAIIGTGAILPGVSGGVLCVAFGIYEPMMNFLEHPIRTFKKHYGITPHQFRKLKKEEQAALLYC